MVAMGRKGGERDTRPVDPMTGRFVDAEKKPPVIDNQPKEEDKSPWFLKQEEEDAEDERVSSWTNGVSLLSL